MNGDLSYLDFKQQISKASKFNKEIKFMQKPLKEK